MLSRTTVLPAAVLVSLAGQAMGDLTMADLAPANTAFIVAIDDMAEVRDRFGETPLAEWWNDPEVQEWFEDGLDGLLQDLNESFESLELGGEDFAAPTGMVGLALWIAPEDGEDGAPKPHILFAADFGDEADTIDETLARVMEEGVDAGTLDVDEDDFDGQTIFTLSTIDDEDDGADEDDPFMAEWEASQGESPFDYDAVYLSRVGSAFIYSSSLGDLEDAIERAKGDGDNALAGQDRYAEALGDFDEAHIYGAMINEPLYELQAMLDEGLGEPDEFGMSVPKIMPILDALGLSEVTSSAVGVTLDGDDGMLEQDFLVRTPVKRGLLGVLAPPSQDFEPPAFITGDAASYSMLQVNFDEILPTLREVTNQIGPDEAAQLRQGLALAQGLVAPIFDQIGPEVYIIEQYDRPYTMESMKITVAIRAKDTDAALESIAQPLEGFVGLVPRDFQGNQIFDAPEGFGPAGGIALGVGSGFVFIGTTESVESALRQAANPGGATLANEEKFEDAARVVPNEGLAFSWSDTRQSLEFQQFVFEEMGEFAAGPFAEFMPPKLEMIAELSGDTVTELRSTERGYEGRSIWLRPAD
ncbi:MAG: hypothetical protein AAGI30_02440 [Planctomycetota bacterium]